MGLGRINSRSRPLTKPYVRGEKRGWDRSACCMVSAYRVLVRATVAGSNNRAMMNLRNFIYGTVADVRSMNMLECCCV